MEEGKNPSASGRVPSSASRRPSSREDEKRFRRLFDQSPFGAALVSPDFRFVESNEKFTAITGYSPVELASLSAPDITHPDDLEAALSLLKRLYAGEIDHFEKEVRCVRKDGGIGWLRMNVRGVRDEEGRLLYFMPLVEDITDRKRTEESLRESEARFRSSMEILPEGFVILKAVRDAGGRVVDFRYEFVNEAACRFAGCRPEDRLGRRLSEVYPAIAGSEFFQDAVRVVEEGTTLVRNDVDFSRFVGMDGYSGRALDIRAARLEDGLIVSTTDVTERKKSSRALYRKVEELEAVLDSVPAVVLISHDPDCSSITGNLAAEKLLRLPRRAEFSMTALYGTRPTHYRLRKDGRLLDPDELPPRRAVRGEAVCDYELDVEFDDGTVRRLSGNSLPLLDADRKPFGSVTSFTDVTESRRMEETLRENERRFRLLFDQLPLGATLVSPDFRFLELNKAYCDIMGYSREELMSLTFADISHPEDLEADLAQAGQLLDGKIDQYEMEKRFLRKNGTIIWVRLTVGGIRDEEGRLVSFLATLEDITQKRATEEALRESETRFRTSLEILPECYAIIKAIRGGKGRTTDFRCDYLNEAACRMTGLRREETVGRNLVEMFPPLRNSDLLKNLLLTLNRKEPLIRNDVEFPDDFAIAGFSGRTFDIRAARLGDGLVVAWTDVTERKRMEDALRLLLGEKDNLLRELSHRTKNNMQVIEGLLGLQAAKSGDACLARMLGEARNRIRAMALVHEKLFKSGSAASLGMKDYVTDLVTSLLNAQQEVSGSVKPVLELEDISLSLDTAVPCGLIINELVSNSLKHAFGEGKPGTIFLSLRRDAGEVELKYSDDGPGLPKDMELFRIESLGLKLVHSLAVRQLRGKVELVSDPRSEFVFRFKDFDVANRL